MPGSISPTCERKAGSFCRFLGRLTLAKGVCRKVGTLSSFGIFGAAMFAEPAVTEIEEMVGLIQEIEVRDQKSEIRSQRSEVRSQRLEVRDPKSGEELLVTDL